MNRSRLEKYLEGWGKGRTHFDMIITGMDVSRRRVPDPTNAEYFASWKSPSCTIKLNLVTDQMPSHICLFPAAFAEGWEKL